MSRWIRFASVVGLALLGVGTTSVARAATVSPNMAGDTLTVNYLYLYGKQSYPDKSMVGVPARLTVPASGSASTTVSYKWGRKPTPFMTISANASSISLNFLLGVIFPTTTFSGFTVSGITQNMTGVTQTGGQSGIVTLSGSNTVNFNLEGLTFNAGSTVTATPLFAQVSPPPGVVPLPQSLPMLLAGLALLGLVGRRRVV